MTSVFSPLSWSSRSGKRVPVVEWSEWTEQLSAGDSHGHTNHVARGREGGRFTGARRPGRHARGPGAGHRPARRTARVRRSVLAEDGADLGGAAGARPHPAHERTDRRGALRASGRCRGRDAGDGAASRRRPTRSAGWARARGPHTLMVFLDASIIIYFVEQPLVWGPTASARLADLRAAGETFAATELVRM